MKEEEKEREWSIENRFEEIYLHEIVPVSKRLDFERAFDVQVRGVYLFLHLYRNLIKIQHQQSIFFEYKTCLLKG